MRTLFLTSTIALLGLCGTAEAHFILMMPPQVNTADASQGKGSPPCGPDTGMAATPTTAQGGHPLMIKLNETVPHDGFYRVALAISSRTEIPVDNVVYNAAGMVLPPSGATKGTSDHADFEMTPVFPVLADHLFVHVGTGAMTFMGSVMLPNVNCDRCILQVIEFMHPHGFNTSVPGPGGGYFYHHCAELKITADPTMPIYPGGTDGGTTDATGTGGTTGAGGTTGTAGTGGTTGTAGTGGTTGTGTAGTTGSGTGTAGTTGSGTGTAGTTGSGTGTAGMTGSGTAGTTGTGTGAAGTTPPRMSGGGGCTVSGHSTTTALTTLLLAMTLAIPAWRRRRRPR
jgi:hypothetical protein